MSEAMETTKAEALDLIRKWMQEERIVVYAASLGPLVDFGGSGFILSITEEELRIWV
ncbi:MAG: hypothetical protein ACRD3P_11875 [Terriglobales bacterium]